MITLTVTGPLCNLEWFLEELSELELPEGVEVVEV